MGRGKKVRRSAAQIEILRRSWRNEKLNFVDIFIYLSSEVWRLDSAVRTRLKTSPGPGCCFLSPVSVSLAAGSNITTVLVSGHEDNIGHNMATIVRSSRGNEPSRSFSARRCVS